MQLVCGAGIGGQLGPHLVDGLRQQGADAGWVDREASPDRGGVGAPLRQLAVVEEGVGPGGQDLVGQDGRLGAVDADHLDIASTEGRPQGDEAIDVHALGEGVVDGLAHQGVVGDGRPGR